MMITDEECCGNKFEMEFYVKAVEEFQ